MYAKIENNAIVKYPYNVSDLKKDNPNVSFPSELSAEVLNSFGVVSVKISQTPTHDTLAHRVVEKTPVFVDGEWTQSWEVEQLPIGTASANVRNHRDSLLAETDWRVIKHLELNENIPGVWEVYRQSLRDVPSQAGFPYNVTWPVKPS